MKLRPYLAVGAAVLSLLLLFGAPQGSQARSGKEAAPIDAADLVAISDTFVQIAEKVTPAVVGISTTRVVSGRDGSPFSDPYFRWFFGDRMPRPQDREEEGLGSGVIVSSDGLIVTNSHVVNGADHIRVSLSDRRAFKAEVVGVDEKTDLAVLRIEGKAKGLPWVPFGDSADLRPGEVVLTVGNPFGLSHTVTMGIISAVSRQGVGITDYEDFIQTDAAINPGNSGGAMVNTRGELIGINTAIFTQSGGYEGIGFAIPANLAKSVMKSLVERGRVVRGWLGVSIQEITPELAAQFGLKSPTGALVTDVIKDGPAEAGGLKRGDVILELNGQKIDRLSQLRLLVASTEVGTKVKLRVIRDGKHKTLSVTLGELPEDVAMLKGGSGGPSGSFDNVLDGVRVSAIDRDAMGRFRLAPGVTGVVIEQVSPGSAASRAGLLPGDVIVEINRKPISGVDEYTRIAREIKSGEQALLLISRRGQTLYVGVEP